MKKRKSKEYNKKLVALLVRDNPGFFINQSLIRIPSNRPYTPTPDNNKNKEKTKVNLNIEIFKKLNI